MEKDFREFLESGPDLSTCEYFLPTILDHMMKDGLEIKVLPTTSIWKGVTYKEDVEELDLNPIARDKKYKIEISSQKISELIDNQIIITVKYGEKKEEYKIKIIRDTL